MGVAAHYVGGASTTPAILQSIRRVLCPSQLALISLTARDVRFRIAARSPPPVRCSAVAGSRGQKAQYVDWRTKVGHYRCRLLDKGRPSRREAPCADSFQALLILIK